MLSIRAISRRATCRVRFRLLVIRRQLGNKNLVIYKQVYPPDLRGSSLALYVMRLLGLGMGGGHCGRGRAVGAGGGARVAGRLAAGGRADSL